MENKKQVKVGEVTIEGLIGSGKSEWLKQIKKRFPKVPIATEPVHQWVKIQDDQKRNMLGAYYENQSKYATDFQFVAAITRLDEVKRLIDIGITSYLSERCIRSDRFFVEMNYKRNNMDNMQVQMYNATFSVLHSLLPWIPETNGIIYIDTSIDICMQRIKESRQRPEEVGIPRDYLEDLEKIHHRELFSKHEKFQPLSSLEEFRVVNDQMFIINGNATLGSAALGPGGVEPKAVVVCPLADRVCAALSKWKPLLFN
jgi:deoxyadenosine/deoxycytidine kinase